MSASSAWTGAKLHVHESDLLCRTGCGFYGNPAWEGHCSKCYKELIQKNQQRKTVFDPTQKIRNKVSRSVSDVSELTSTATSLMSRKFDRFEEKRRQQLDKKTKAVKSIFRKTPNKDPAKASRQLSVESQSVGQEFNDFLKTVSKDVQHGVSKQINSFVDKMLHCVESQNVDESGEQVHDFYNNMNDLLTKHTTYQGLKQEQIDRINELTERYVTTRLYKTLISVVNATNEDKDLAIQNRIRSLAWVSSQHLDCGVQESNGEVRETLDLVITELIEMNSKRVPSDKLRCLVWSSHHVLNLLKQSRGGTLASADDFLPALIYCVLQANPPLLHSNIAYITNFAQQSSLQSGEAGYFFTNLCCAVAFIEKLTAESLGLREDEFQRYMSGAALPPNALEGDTWLCEGMRIMQQNLKTLDDLQARTDRLLTESDSLLTEMDDLKENVSKEVQSVMERDPWIIRPRRVNIDEEVPASDLLPPPLTPQQMEGGKLQMRKLNVKAVDSIVGSGSLSCADAAQSTTGPPLSPDILAAQQSLSFLQGLTDLDMGLLPPLDTNEKDPVQGTNSVEATKSQQDCKSLLDDSPPSKMSSLPDLLDSFGTTMGQSMKSISIGETDRKNSCESLPPSLDSSVSFTNPFVQPFNATLPSPLSPQQTVGQISGLGEGASVLTNTHNNTKSSYTSSQSRQTSYSGFTIQGGKIPSIPCETGDFHSFSASHDPLSPPLEGPQASLPPPLIPTTSGSEGSITASAEGNQKSSERQLKREDTIDKVYNVLGDIVQTFDNLL